MYTTTLSSVEHRLDRQSFLDLDTDRQYTQEPSSDMAKDNGCTSTQTFFYLNLKCCYWYGAIFAWVTYNFLVTIPFWLINSYYTI